MKSAEFLFRTKILLLSLFLIFFAAGCSTIPETENNENNEGYNYNIDELNSYGEWLYVNPYGRVWRPFASNGWEPFDNGYWSLSAGNRIWMSNEPFGNIVYHYGNWYDDPIYGWIWIPSNNIWSPARVRWYDYDDYIGWAPLAPAGIKFRNTREKSEMRHRHIVKRRDFDHNYIFNDPMQNTAGRGLMERQPERAEIEKATGRKNQDVKTRRETVASREKNIQKKMVRQEQRKEVERNPKRPERESQMKQEMYRREHSPVNHSRENNRGDVNRDREQKARK